MNREIWRLGAILGLLSSVGPFAIDMYLPALPTIALDLESTMSASQASIMVFLIALGLGQLIYGPLSDQYGRKPPLYVGLFIFLAGSLACFVAPSIEFLVAARFFQGLGAAAMSVIPRAIVRDRYTGPEATRLMSTIMIVVSVSPLCAPLIGSGIILLGSWRLVFALLCVLAIASLILTQRSLTETHNEEVRKRLNLRTIYRDSKRLFTHRQFMLLSMVNSTGLASFFLFIASAPFVYTDLFGLSPTQFSVAFAFNAFGFFGASQFAAPLGKRFGSGRIVYMAVAGFAILTTALMLLSTINLSSLVTISVLLFLANACLGLVIPTASVMSIHDQGDIAGLASSVGGAIQWMAGGIAILLIGPFFDGTIFPMTASIAACGLLALTFIVFARPAGG